MGERTMDRLNHNWIQDGLMAMIEIPRGISNLDNISWTECLGSMRLKYRLLTPKRTGDTPITGLSRLSWSITYYIPMIHKKRPASPDLKHRITFLIMNLFSIGRKYVKSTGLLSLVWNFEHFWSSSENYVSIPIRCPHKMSASDVRKNVRIRRPHDLSGRSYARAPSGPLAPAGVI